MLSTLFRLLMMVFQMVFVVATAAALLLAGLGYALYRLVGGKTRVRGKPTLVRQGNGRQGPDRDKVWLRLRLPGFGRRNCPHCKANLAPDADLTLCPDCYGDLKNPCPGCGEAVGVQIRICPHCKADLRPSIKRW